MSIPEASNDDKGIELAELTSELIRAARALLRWEQRHLAEASGVSLPTIKRLESQRGTLRAHGVTVMAIRRALEAAGIEFINGGQPGVRLMSTAAKQIDRSD
jgi:transcriptional regulator with XRE-family HTH domain